MAFVTGTANSFADIDTALFGACTANGWTLTSGIVHRGDCYVARTVYANRIEFQCGTGQSGSTLINPTPANSGVGTTIRFPTTTLLLPCKNEQTITWPATYYISVIDDEVYLDINFNGDGWLNGGFGISPIDSGYTGAGVWMSWSAYDNSGGNGTPGSVGNDLSFAGSGINGMDIGSIYGTSRFNGPSIGLFHALEGIFNSLIYHNAWGTPEWAGVLSTRFAYTYSGMRQRWGLENPASNWNNAAGLFPIQPAVVVASNKLCVVGELKHARYFRIDNHTPGDIVTFGTDKWKVYPLYRKNTAVRSPQAAYGILHSGTFARAIRYDGP